MNSFIKAFAHFQTMKKYGDYRFVWVPMDKNGKGLWTFIEFFDYELEHVDPKKVEIII